MDIPPDVVYIVHSTLYMYGISLEKNQRKNTLLSELLKPIYGCIAI